MNRVFVLVPSLQMFISLKVALLGRIGIYTVGLIQPTYHVHKFPSTEQPEQMLSLSHSSLDIGKSMSLHSHVSNQFLLKADLQQGWVSGGGGVDRVVEKGGRCPVSSLAHSKARLETTICTILQCCALHFPKHHAAPTVAALPTFF